MTALDENIDGKFNIGKILSDSFSIFLSDKLWTFFAIVILFQIPSMLWSVLSGDYKLNLEDPEALSNINHYEHYGIYVLDVLSSLLAEAGVVYGVFLHISGRQVTITECVAKSLSIMVPILVVGVLTVILFYGGLLLLIVPGVYAMALLAVVGPVIVVEQPGIIASMKRSSDLSKGSRWPLSGIFIISFSMYIALELLFPHLAIYFDELGMDLIAFILEKIIQTFLSTYWLIAVAVVYLKLRVLKEGPSREHLASVFD